MAAIRFPLAFLALLLCLPSLAKEATWIKLRSENFEIYSAENDKKARKVLEHLERTRRAFSSLTKVEITAKEPVRVILFRNEKEYREYAPGQFSQAYYMSARDRDYIVLSDFTTDTERVLNHEYFHLFSKHVGFKFPVWLEEGLADLYSTLQITSKEVSVAHPIINHLRYLNALEGRPIPIANIVAVDHQNRHDGDRRQTSALYAQGWALAHMTFYGPEMSARSQDFFRNIKTGEVSTELAYQMAYGWDLKKLDQMLANYIERQTYYYGKSPATGLDFDAPVEPASLEDWETPLILADLLAFTRKTSEAIARYEQLSQRFSNRPEVDESRAYLYLHTDKRAEALPFLRAAAQKRSTNPMLYFHLATMACSYYEANDDCRNWINESLRLDPANKQARQWAIGYALNTRQFENALIYMARSGSVTPEEAPEFFHKMAYARYHLNDFAEARASVNRGLEFAKKPVDINKLQELAKYIKAAEMARNGDARPMEAVPSIQPSDAGSAGESRPTLSRRQASSPVVPERSDADRAIEQFIVQDGAILANAEMQNLDCRGESPVLVVQAKGAPLRLVIDQPNAIHVIRHGELIVDHEFVCGKQKPVSLLVGYLTQDAPDGSDGFLRILSFR